MYERTQLRKKVVIGYKRNNAVSYAHKWALERNPKYYDFDEIGGDCTNFVSQVLYAGSKVMNYSPVFGWYYSNPGDRTPSWTGVRFLFDFLVNNKDTGPFAEETNIKSVKPGDIVQLSFQGNGFFEHSLVVVETGNSAEISTVLIATHTIDRDNTPLSIYDWKEIRFIHILGVRKYS